MRPQPWDKVERWRQPQLAGQQSEKGDDFGVFLIPHRANGRIDNIVAIVSNGDEMVRWEHVSVSIPGVRRTPDWEEMDFIRGLFWADDETVMQLHVPLADHINDHPYVLHLWRPKDAEIPRPPRWTV